MPSIINVVSTSILIAVGNKAKKPEKGKQKFPSDMIILRRS